MPRPGSGGTTKLTIKGTRSDDTIWVTAGGVYVNGIFRELDQAKIDAGLIIKGDAGDDLITGGGGADEIDGGAGGDVLNGGGGLDKLFGGVGDDTLSDDLTGAIFDGGRGRDTIDFSAASAGIGIFEHSVETGIDLEFSATEGLIIHRHDRSIEGRVFNIEIYIGSAFEDLIWAGPGDNEIYGGGENDYLNGVGLGVDVDRLFGEAGDDVLEASQGVDWLTGGTGADRFQFTSNQANAGQDVVLDYSKAEGDMLVFAYAQSGPTWMPYSYASENDSMIGTYGSGGGTIILVGVTSIDQITTQLWSGQSSIHYYYYDPMA